MTIKVWVVTSILADFMLILSGVRAEDSMNGHDIDSVFLDTSPLREESPGDHCYEVCET